MEAAGEEITKLADALLCDTLFDEIRFNFIATAHVTSASKCEGGTWILEVRKDEVDLSFRGFTLCVK